jgi:hypothetical protein
MSQKRISLFGNWLPSFRAKYQVDDFSKIFKIKK